MEQTQACQTSLHLETSPEGKHNPPRSQDLSSGQGQSIKGTFHDIDHRWLTFDGRQPYCTTPCKRRRVSVIFYSPGRLDNIPEQVYQQLRSLGFPLPAQVAQPHIPAQWLMPITLEEATKEPDQDAYGIGVIPRTKTKSLSDSSQDLHTVAAVAEHWNVLHQTLSDSSYDIVMHTHAHVQTRRKVHEDLQIFSQQLGITKPSLLWVQWQGEQAPGRRAQ
eukprot:418629-Amphidinium_carterae.1